MAYRRARSWIVHRRQEVSRRSLAGVSASSNAVGMTLGERPFRNRALSGEPKARCPIRPRGERIGELERAEIGGEDVFDDTDLTIRVERHVEMCLRDDVDRRAVTARASGAQHDALRTRHDEPER